MFEGEDIIRYADLLGTAPDVFCFGHWHKDQGVERLGDKTFINIGSLTRGSLSQDEVQRRPACAVISCEIGTNGKAFVEVDVRRLDVKPPEEVFDVEGRARQVRRQTEMDSFVENIRESLQKSDSDDETIEQRIRSARGVSDDVRERGLSYLEQAED
jgi:hypothetical protein